MGVPPGCKVIGLQYMLYFGLPHFQSSKGLTYFRRSKYCYNTTKKCGFKPHFTRSKYCYNTTKNAGLSCVFVKCGYRLDFEPLLWKTQLHPGHTAAFTKRGYRPALKPRFLRVRLCLDGQDLIRVFKNAASNPSSFFFFF